jgi:hypothetical protein
MGSFGGSTLTEALRIEDCRHDNRAYDAVVRNSDESGVPSPSIQFRGHPPKLRDDIRNSKPVFYLTRVKRRGIEAESNIFIGHEVSLYFNGTMSAAKYQDTGLWVANTPRNEVDPIF